jgi:peptide/nickel transport system permease protein
VLAFIVRRIIGLVVVLFAITVLVFLIFFATPGIDPSARLAGRNPSPDTVAAVKHEFGLDRPLPVRYALMMKRLFISRDLVSYGNQALEVVPAIWAAAPVTFSLVIGAAVLWFVGSILLGLIAVTFKGTVVDLIIMILALIGISMPVFWLGEVVNLITQDRLHDTFLFSWVPPLGYTPLTEDPWQWFLHLIFPWITLSILYIGFYARVLRANMLDVANEDFVRTARAKGLSERRVLTRHMLRNSMITFVSLFGLDLAVLIGGGALLTEVVCGLPGVGLLTYRSLVALDLPVIMATVIYGAFFITIANALVDILYARLDPRIREPVTA